MSSTNFLNDIEILQSFLIEGAFIQVSEKQFLIALGPFKAYSSHQQALLDADQSENVVVYSPQFWNFLDTVNFENEYFVAKKSFFLTKQEFIQWLGLGINKIESDDLDKNVLNENKKTSFIAWQTPDPVDFKEQFNWSKNQILTKQILKTLPIAVQSGTGFVRPQIISIINKLIQTISLNFSYGHWNQTTGLIGYTPEILASWNIDKSELKTVALAGTWKKNSSRKMPDFSDAKIKAEHDFVISDIEKQLFEYKIISKSETYVAELPYLYHLKTEFSYECKNSEDYIKSIRCLHPTAALGIYPRDLNIMNEFSKINIQKNRQRFAAPFGFFNQTQGHVVAAIRNIIWSDDQVQLFAGCGVTSDSVFFDEWQEILAKQDSVKKMLGL